MNKLLLSFYILFLVAGCSSAPTTQIAELSQGITEITLKVDTVMQEYNNAALDTQFTNYAASYKNEFAQQFSSKALAQITKPITEKTYTSFSIAKANKALGEYSKALSLLSTANARGDIDLAAAHLYGSMININEQYKTMKGSDNALFDNDNFAKISTLITAIGTVIVEEKRRKAIRGIVIMANDKVALLCDEITQKLSQAAIGDSIAASRQYILSESVKEYRTLAKAPSTLAWRRAEVERLYHLQQNVFNSKLLVQQTRKGVLSVKDAHGILAKELSNNTFTSAALSKVIGRLKDLKNNYENFDSLIVNCNNLIKNERGILSCNDNE